MQEKGETMKTEDTRLGEAAIFAAAQLAAFAMIGKDGLWLTAAAVLLALIRCLKDL